ncbi:DNA/RNA helicase domain-containing protein [uncultured Psychrobacter sp.]|uniref:DNA/RNA helicase domain-containing protein n=1 Tax=uncultured Psychrobacter sp. TaxID=259303 RepID=UPI00259AAF65|nr:DNA/RNA helicase domain-containing protein [uncultured Psychrobacter sp.]
MSYLLAGSIEELSSLSKEEIIRRMSERQLNQNGERDRNNESEIRSWKNSLCLLIRLLSKNGFDNLHLIAEYSLIADRRIDAILLGNDHNNQSLALIVELKQWSELGENHENKISDVNVRIGQDYVYRLHPVIQTYRYEEELQMHHTSVIQGNISITSIQYLHNFSQNKSSFFTGAYEIFAQRKNRLFIKGEEDNLIDYLNDKFDKKIDGVQAAKAFLSGEYTIGEIGFNGIEKVLKGKANATMIEDQNSISAEISEIIKSFTARRRNIGIVIQGAAGTGKTIIGMYTMYLAHKRSDQSIPIDQMLFTFAKSKMLREVVKQEASLSYHFPYLDNVKAGKYEFIVVDEAHRITDVNKTLYGLYEGNQKPKIIIFLQDDFQRVLPSERGTLKEFTRIMSLGGIEQYNFKLKVQKRSGNQGDFVDKIHKLFYDPQLSVSNNPTKFKVELDASLIEIDLALKEHISSGNSAKWFAPYDWAWRSRNNLNIKDDISIIENGHVFQKQWNPMKDQYKWYKSDYENAFDQVGSVYTAQGLDYDYIGFIWYKDLYWDENENRWRFNLDTVQDPTFKREATEYLKNHNYSKASNDFILEIIFNQYYVLLTRARKGIYIWFDSEATKRKFQSVMDVS